MILSLRKKFQLEGAYFGEKMVLQSIFDSAFTDKIPGRGSVPRLQRRSSERQCADNMEKISN